MAVNAAQAAASVTEGSDAPVAAAASDGGAKPATR